MPVKLYQKPWRRVGKVWVKGVQFWKLGGRIEYSEDYRLEVWDEAEAWIRRRGTDPKYHWVYQVRAVTYVLGLGAPGQVLFEGRARNLTEGRKKALAEARHQFNIS